MRRARCAQERHQVRERAGGGLLTLRPDATPHACAQVKSQRFFYDAATLGHPGISIVRPTSSQRLRFGFRPSPRAVGRGAGVARGKGSVESRREARA